MQRQQNTTKVGYRQRDRMESEGYAGAQSAFCGEQTSRDGVLNLLERILSRENLNQAYLQVIRNKGAQGIDGMTYDQLLPYLKENREKLLTEIYAGVYQPSPVRRVEIPKPGGGVRKLGIPTVIDRMIQQAIHQILQPIFDPGFSENSFGFRPGRSAHDAIKKAKSYYEEGFKTVVDIDMKSYFDTLNHDKLMYLLEQEIKDKRVLKLIRLYLKSGILIGGLFERTETGSPQGGPLSPLLSNVYLHEFDKLLEARGLRYARYADDCAPRKCA